MKTRDLIDLLVLGAIWGASFLFMRVAAPEFGAIPLIAARVGIAAIFLIVVLAQRGGLPHLYPNAARLTLARRRELGDPFFAVRLCGPVGDGGVCLGAERHGAALRRARGVHLASRQTGAYPDRGVDRRLCGCARARVGQVVRGERRGRGSCARRAVCRGAVRHLGELRKETDERHRSLRDCDRQPHCGDRSSLPVGAAVLASDAAEPPELGERGSAGRHLHGRRLHPLFPPAQSHRAVKDVGGDLSDSRIRRVVGASASATSRLRRAWSWGVP